MKDTACCMQNFSFEQTGFVFLNALFVLSSKVKIPILLQLSISSLLIIIIGSKWSLKQKLYDLNNNEGSIEVVHKRDAALSPIIASVCLFGCYLIMKNCPDYVLQTIILLNIGLASVFACSSTFVELVEPFQWSKAYPQRTFRYKIVNKFFSKFIDKVEIEYGVLHIIATTLSVAIYLSWYFSNNWLLHNLIAVCLCIHAIRYLSIGTFKTASILLIGLFFYDIFWVFRTEVMAEVAKNLVAPIKLLFPVTKNHFSMLGLGDIVIPGLYIALTLRYDYFTAQEKDKTPDNFYFKCTLVAYAISIILTGIIMILFSRPQPALLYLVPGLFIGLYLPALIKKDLTSVFSYTEEIEEEEKDKEEEEDEEEDKKSENDNDSENDSSTEYNDGEARKR